MDNFHNYVLSQVTEYITEIQKRDVDEAESIAVADTVYALACNFIATQISNALS